MELSRRHFNISALTASFGAISGSALAQGYPTKPITLIVPFPAGGATDTLARVIVDAVRPKLNGNLIIENKPGANTQIGVQAALAAPADGYTLYMGGGGTGILGIVNPSFTTDLRKELVGVAGVGQSFTLICVTAKLPVKSLDEFVKYAKANPGVLNYGIHSGSDLLANNAFVKALGIKVTNVRYGGSAPVKAGILRGDIHYSVFFPGDIAPHLESGAVRAIAITGSQRDSEFPDLPSIAEYAKTDVAYAPWAGIFAKVGTPRSAVEHISKYVAEALNDPQVQAKIKLAGYKPLKRNLDELSKYWVDDVNYWTRVAKETGFKPE
jgi:tripartite-type tricarboxylate transporter receptor subunit TctC